MSKQEMIRYFDSVAPRWDTMTGAATLRVAGAALRRAGVRRGAAVLDVGAGTGLLLPLLRRMGIERYTGLEISGEMIREFRHKYPEVPLVRGDFEEDPALGERFDFIIVFNTFPLFHSPRRAFESARRLLSPGGRLIVAQDRTRETLERLRASAGATVRGYVLPTDEEIRGCCGRLGFEEPQIDDRRYFYLAVRAAPDP